MRTPSILTAICLFISLWITSGLLITEYDLDAYTLQHAGIDAWATFGNPRLGQSSNPAFQPKGDVFEYEGGLYPAKQPGQFILGAIPYWFVKAAGLSYESNYRLAAAWVTFLSSGLISALAFCIMFYGLQSQYACRPNSALIGTISVAFCSQWLPYTGVTHHDILASSFLLIAFFCGRIGASSTNQNSALRILLTAFFIGLSIFVSMLPALIAFVLALALALRTPFKRWPLIALGGVAGLTPLLIYNYIAFGHPFLQANVAGDYQDTYFRIYIKGLLHHLNAYFGIYGLSQWLYAPALMIGAIAIFYLPKENMKLKRIIISIFFIHLFYILNIDTLGTCSYGPRYLIPLLPFAGIGLALLIERLKTHTMQSTLVAKVSIQIIVTLIIYGALVALTGALLGTMNCDLAKFQMNFLLDSNKPAHTGYYPLLANYWIYATVILTPPVVYLVLKFKRKGQLFT